MGARSLPVWFPAVLLCAALSPVALGVTTLYVGNGETDLPTLQAAVDLAADGDIVVVNPGTYHGPGNGDVDLRGKAVTLRSTDPLDWNLVERPVVDCAGSPLTGASSRRTGWVTKERPARRVSCACSSSM